MGPKLLHKPTFHDLDMAEQSIHNKNILAENISRDECEIFLNRVLNALRLFISNVAGLGCCQMLAT